MIFSPLKRWVRDWKFWDHFGIGWSARNQRVRGKVRRTIPLRVELLEDRINPAPTPAAVLVAPVNPILGATVPLAVSYTSTDTVIGAQTAPGGSTTAMPPSDATALTDAQRQALS